MPMSQADKEQPAIEPLTRRNADGELYRRDLVVEQQIEDALRLTCHELIIRASVIDKSAAGYLKEETLVHLIRRGRRQHQPDLVSDLSLVLLRRCTPLVNRRLSSLSKEALADAYAETVASLFEQILNLESDRGDFAQVRFWVIVERLVVRAFDKQVWEANRARQVIYLSEAEDDECDDQPNGGYTLETCTNGEGDQHSLEATIIERESLREALSLIEDRRHRTAFLLRYVAGWPIEANDPSERSISRHFDVSARTIRTWLHLAKEALGQWKQTQP
ncbi:MAG: hypothetical protein JO023_17145 [Chloroflexi bacterium]|nr:hypothetical protein [Chloroflexota bacterium]